MRAAFAIALLIAIAAMAGSAPALAAEGHPVLDTIPTGPGSGVRSVATDSSENIYVLESGSGQVSKFDSAGNPVAFTGSAPYISGSHLTGAPPLPGGVFKQNEAVDIAVDRAGGATDGYIYVLYTYGNPYGEPPSEYQSQVLVFDPTGVYKGSYGLSENPYCAVLVSPGSGDVYLARNGDIHRYAPTTGDPSTATQTGQLNVSTCLPALPAVDSTGAVYANDFSDTQKWSAAQFEAASPEPEFHIPIAFPGAMATDPVNDDLYLVREGIRHYDSNGNAIGEPFGVLYDNYRLAVDGNHRILDAEFSGGIVIYSPNAANLPVVAAEPASVTNVTHHSAEVTGRVEPDGAGNIIGCEFRLNYGEYKVPCTPAASPGSPITSPTTVTATYTGLEAETTYQSRLFVTNANGTQLGQVVSFTTPIAVAGLSTDPAIDVTKESAKLNASFDGEGLDTHYYFEWGLTSEYGNVSPGSPADAGSGTGRQPVAPIEIDGLAGNTTYHYRVVASNENGTTRGPDATFTTAPSVTDLTPEYPTEITNHSAVLQGSYTADKYETHFHYEWGPTTKYGNSVPIPDGVMPAGNGNVSFPGAPISGLQEGVTYHFRIVAENENGKTVSADFAFKTAEPPSVENLDTREVTAHSAVLMGEVNPHSADTSYRFEWGSTTSYGNSVPVPDGSVGSGTSLVPVSAQLENLDPATTYHFRIVATNEYGTTVSVDQSFSFYPPACPNSQLRQETRSSLLPDCRAYELVTPSFAQGAVIFPLNGPNTGLATNPAKLAYGAAFGVFPPDTGEPINSIADLYVSTRTPTGWYQKYIGRPASETGLMGGPPENYVGNILQGQLPSKNQRGTAVSPKMDRAIDYDLGYPSGNYGQLGEPSNAPYVWDTGTGNLVERWPTNLDQIEGGKDFVGIPKVSADFTHFVFSSNVVFAPGGIPSEQKIECCFGNPPEVQPKASIYDNDLTTGEVKLASTTDENPPQAFEGYIYDVSEDGSHILMNKNPNMRRDIFLGEITRFEVEGPLYLRADGERTYEIAAGHSIYYVGSTADGETVYVTSKEQLTSEDTDTSNDLYAWRESDEELHLISIGTEGNAGNTDECSASWTEKCGVRIIDFKQYSGFGNGDGGNGISDNFIAPDSGDIYFESPEQLTGPRGDPDAVNLYVFRKGELRYVTTMDPKPLCTASNEATICSLTPVARMQVTRDGKHMALITNSHLTAYDNGERGEMYLYNPETGRIACASCRTDGEPPVGETLGSQNGRFITEDGRAFFVSDDALAPRDTDKVEDVYEYTQGKPWLITTGIGTGFKGFGGFTGGQTKPGLVSVSRDGTDVYFATMDTLVTQDHNGRVIKIYDARTAGGFAAETTSAKCAAADECHGPSSERPALPPDRTSADLGTPRTKGAHHRKRCRAAKRKGRKHLKKHCASKKKRKHRGRKRNAR